MLDLDFDIEGAEPERAAAAPLLLFKLRVREPVAVGRQPTPVHAALLRCQVRIEPARRRYEPAEQDRLRDLFGTPDRWGQTVRPMLWAHTSVTLRPFTGEAVAELPVPCSFDFSLAATRYFDALEDGDVPLCFLFSGTVFYQGGHGGLHVAQVPWEKEAYFRLPAATWKALMDLHYPDCGWLCLRKDVFDRLSRFRSGRGLATFDQALESLLAEQEVTP